MKYFTLLKNKNFLLLWSSQVISACGSRLYQLAIIWWLLNNSTTSSKGFIVGCFMLMSSLPAVIFSKIIGKWIDQYPRKNILIICDSMGVLITCALLGSFYSFGLNQYFLFACSFLYATFAAFISPTLNRSVPEVINKPSDLNTAMSFISSTENLAFCAGAASGVVLIDFLGPQGIIFLNGLSYLVSLIFDSQLNFHKKNNVNTIKTPTEKQSQSNNGYNFDKLISTKYKNVKDIVYSFSIVNFFITPLMIIIPIYTKELLKGSSAHLSLFESVLWCGMLLGSFYNAFIGLKNHSLKLASFFLLVFSSGLLLMVFKPTSIVFAFSIFLCSYSIGLINVRMMTLFQKIVPDEIKGSFFSFLQGTCGVAVPLSFLIFGVLTDHLSLQKIISIQVLALLIISFCYLIWSKKGEDHMLVNI